MPLLVPPECHSNTAEQQLQNNIYIGLLDCLSFTFYHQNDVNYVS